MRFDSGLSMATFGTGPPVVLLPGLGRGADLSEGVPPSAKWAAQTLARGVGRTVHLINRPVTVEPGMTVAMLADWHATLLRERFPGGVAVVGTSAGGITALQLAMDHPDVVHRVVVAIAAARVTERGRQALARQVAAEQAGRSAAWPSSALVAHGPLRLVVYAAFRLGERSGPRRAQGEAALVAAVQTWDVMDRLAEITAPTLVVGGTRDPLISEEALHRTAAGIPNGHLVLAPGRGHLTAMWSGRISAAMKAFLNAPPTGPDPHSPHHR
jgi:pimeloyl-ACP methyl ester carboxylesterase